MPKFSNAGQTLDIVIAAGARFYLPLQLVDRDGAPLSLAGRTIIAHARRTGELTGPPAFVFDIDRYDAANGHFALVVEPAASKAIPHGDTEHAEESQYRWDCFVDSERRIQGVARVSPSQTDDAYDATYFAVVVGGDTELVDSNGNPIEIG